MGAPEDLPTLNPVADALDALDAAGAPGGALNVPPPAEPPPPGHVGVMIPLREDDAVRMAVPGGEPAEDLHLTLLYLGRDGDHVPADIIALGDGLSAIAESCPPFNARIAGLARFEETDGGRDAVVALVSSPELDALRALVVERAEALGLRSPSAHGFLPHITLGYTPPGVDIGVARAALAAIAVDHVALWRSGDRRSYPLRGTPRTVEVVETSTETTMPTSASATSADQPPVTASVDAPVEVEAPPPPVETPTPATLRGQVVQFDTGDGEPVENVDWNRAHVVGRLRAWASSDGTGDYATLDAGKLAQAFVWYDPTSAAAGNISAFRLPHHDVVNGKLALTRQGLLAACRAIMGGEHGIPDEDLPEVQSHLARHCAQFGMAAPWVAQPVGTTELDPAAMSAEGAPGLSAGVVSESWIQVARVGRFRGHSAGEFEFNTDVFARIRANFLATANRRVPVDYEHATEILNQSTLQNGAPAVGWIVELDNRGDAGLYGRVQWCDAEAVGYIRTGRYRYFSPAVVFAAVNPVTGEPQGPTLVSGGLTNRPFLDGMEPVTARAEAAEVVAAKGVAETVEVVVAETGTAPATTAPVKPLAGATEAEGAAVQARIDALPPDARAVIAASAACLAAAEPGQSEAPVVTPDASSDTTVVVPPEDSTTTPAPTTLRDALAIAWESAPVSAELRVLSWGGWIDNADDFADLVSFAAYILGLPRLASADVVLAELNRLAAYVVGDMGARDAVDVDRVIRHLRGELNLPALTPAAEVVGSLIRRLTDTRPVAMTIGPSDVHVPAATDLPDQTETKEPPVNPEILAALHLSATATDAEVLAAVTALSARAERSDRDLATRAVDGLIQRGALAASSRDTAIVAAMRDLDGFVGMFPAPPPAPATPAAPEKPASASREVPTALSQPLSQPAPTSAAAPGAPPPPAPPPAPRSPEYSSRLHAEATARMRLAAAAGAPITLRAAMEGVEASWAAIRGV